MIEGNEKVNVIEWNLSARYYSFILGNCFNILAMNREKKETLLNVDLFPRDFSFGVLSPAKEKYMYLYELRF